MIAVIIPTLNTRDEYISLALHSVLGQTYLPQEVIIVNNGHGEILTPESTVPIKTYNVIYKAGVAQARNFGVSLTTCDYVAFLDDDDLWAPDYLEHMVEQIRSEKPDCLIARLDQMVDGEVMSFKNARGKINKTIILVRNPGITGSSVVVKKESFVRVGGYDPKLPPSEDKALILEFLNNGFKVITVPKCQAIQHQHQTQDRLTESRSMAEGIFQFYRKYKPEMGIYQRFYNLMKINKYRWMSQKSIRNLIFVRMYLLALVPLQYFVKKEHR